MSKTNTKTIGGAALVEKNNSILGKPAIVRSNVAGVHMGRVESIDTATQTVVLKDAYRLWRVFTRDTTGSISDIAAHGLKTPLSQHSIGARLDQVMIINPNGLEIAVATEDAYKSVADASAKG